VLKSVGIVPILLEYLANPLHLYCASALIGNDERQLCLELLQPPAAGTNTHASSSRSGHTAKKPSMSSKGGESESESEEDEEDEELQETCSSEGEAESDETIRAKSEAAPAAELNAHTSKDDEVRRILYALSRRMLKLTFHFLVGNAGNQDAFRRDNGLRRLYAMLNDVALRGPILRVVAIIAIGSSSSTPSAGATIKSETGGGTGSEDVGGAIIRDIISVLQSSGGTSALSKEVRIRVVVCVQCVPCVSCVSCVCVCVCSKTSNYKRPRCYVSTDSVDAERHSRGSVLHVPPQRQAQGKVTAPTTCACGVMHVVSSTVCASYLTNSHAHSGRLPHQWRLHLGHFGHERNWEVHRH
jgi:hypothetical protein